MTATPNRADGLPQAEGERVPIVPWLIVAGVGLVAVVAALGIANRAAIASALEYTRVTVAQDQPMRAVHEMANPGITVEHPIPFLPEGAPQPKVVIPSAFYDFGTVGPRDVIQHSFIVANDGQAPLTISRAYTTCGCTMAEISSSIIPPGEAARVTVLFDASFHPDVAGTTIRRALVLENNDPLNPRVEIWIQANIRAEP